MLLDLFTPRRPAHNAAPGADSHPHRLGSEGEHTLQELFGTATRANAFYTNQVIEYLNDEMQEFIGRMEMVVIATADANGECDASFRAGEPGFVHVLSPSIVAYPEYRGNGVMASLGNMSENPHIGLIFVDFFRDKIGLHVNGRVRIVASDDLLQVPDLPDQFRANLERDDGRKAEHWVVVDIEEAFIHCSKHIPRLRKLEATEDLAWGTDDVKAKGGDYFRVAAARRAAAKAAA
jgi:uncharacterized protein